MKYRIGDVVSYSKCYPRKVALRFPNAHENVLSPEPTPIKNTEGDKNGIGFMVGERTVIMTNHQRYHSYVDDETGDAGGGWAKGEKELVLLIVDSRRQEPFIVRLCDAEKMD